ncbi:hypothetical protein ACWCPD_25395 [Streptomyces sp. NPDC001935]
MIVPLLRRTAAPAVTALLMLTATTAAIEPAHAAADRIRLGNAGDVSREPAGVAPPSR